MFHIKKVLYFLIVLLLNWRRLCEDGYFYLEPSEMEGAFRDLSIPVLVKSIKKIVESGHPASYFNMYDEAWVIAHRVSALMEQVSHNKVNFDMLSWWRLHTLWNWKSRRWYYPFIGIFDTITMNYWSFLGVLIQTKDKLDLTLIEIDNLVIALNHSEMIKLQNTPLVGFL